MIAKTRNRSPPDLTHPAAHPISELEEFPRPRFPGIRSRRSEIHSKVPLGIHHGGTLE
jgi:hypothetical protein